MTETNADQRAFWSDQAGPLWVAQMARMDAALFPVLDLVLQHAEIAAGERVLDIGCGAGTSTLAAAELTGTAGHVEGFDISDSLLTLARQRADGLPNVNFSHGDAQTHAFAASQASCMISRFGVMFFDNTTAALANMAKALVPGGRMVFATWGDIPENPYFTLPARTVRDVLGTPPKTDPDAPGPFALRDTGKVKEMFQAAGIGDIEAIEVSLDLTPQGDATDVAALMCQIGPAQSALAHFEADEAARAQLQAAISDALSIYQRPEGIRIPALINIFRARKAA